MEVQATIADRVAGAIANATGGAIALDRLRDTRGRPPENLGGYECVLLAIEITSALNIKEAATARACLERAVAREPGYADAWALLANIYTYYWSSDLAKEQWRDWRPQEAALEAAHKAVALAPDSARARQSLARAAFFMGDLRRFREEAWAALRLNPNDSYALGMLGNFLAYTGSWEEGTALVRKALALTPVAYPRWWPYALAKDHLRKGELEEAVQEFRRAEIPGLWLTHLQLAYANGLLGDRAAAAAAVRNLEEVRPGTSIATAVAFYRKHQFEPSYIELMAEGLRAAGLPEGELVPVN
jgi:Tfp pilus assembly protein PilF